MKLEIATRLWLLTGLSFAMFLAAMEQGVKRVEGGVALAREAGQSVAGIRDGAAQATRAVADINTVLQEQSVTAREIAQRVERIASGFKLA